MIYIQEALFGIDRLNVSCLLDPCEPTNYFVVSETSQQTRDIRPLLLQCWANVVDGGPTLNQHWLDDTFYRPTCKSRMINLQFSLGVNSFLCIEESYYK